MPSSIPIPQIKFGKRKERSVMCEVFRDDGKWTVVELPALYSCVDNDMVKPGVAFLIDADNQYLAEDGNWHQLITEKSQIPICLRKVNMYQDGKNDDKELEELGNELFIQTFEEKQVEAIEKAQQADKWDKVQRIVIIVCATILVIVGIRWITGGMG